MRFFSDVPLMFPNTHTAMISFALGWKRQIMYGLDVVDGDPCWNGMLPLYCQLYRAKAKAREPDHAIVNGWWMPFIGLAVGLLRKVQSDGHLSTSISRDCSVSISVEPRNHFFRVN